MRVFTKVMKYLALALAISIIAGIVSSIYYLGDGIANMFKHEEVSDNVSDNVYALEFEDGINELNVNVNFSKLVIKSGEKFRVESNNKSVVVNNSNGILKVVDGKRLKNNNITIYIPNNFIFDKVKIDTGVSSVNIDKLSGYDVDLNLGVGNLVIESLTAIDKCDIDTGAGRAVINDADINNLDLDIGAGQFIYNGIMRNKATVDAGVGEVNINLKNKDSYVIYVEKGIGNITIDGVSVGDGSTYGNGNNRVDISGGIGSIKVNFDK